MFRRLFKIREHGIQGVEKSRRYTARPTCNSLAHNFESVGIIDCHAAFLVLVYGIAATLGILCLEFLSKIQNILLQKAH